MGKKRLKIALAVKSKFSEATAEKKITVDEVIFFASKLAKKKKKLA